jgi:redox-sensitive bicupin YhaK (pirin superfamily)
MKAADYRDIQSNEIPVVELTGGGRVKVIAGTLDSDSKRTAGPIRGLSTDPLYFDVELPAGAKFRHVLPAGHHAFIYPFEGSVAVGAEGAQKILATHHAGILSDGDEVEFSGGPDGGRVILLAGRPLLEPIVQYGPFVMNTREEIEQAVRDYQSGTLTGEATARA